MWYLAHFDIYHPRKPDQIRLVFDCSALFHDQSLNKHLLPGPDLMNGLIGVLTLFLKKDTAVTCDVEQMCHSVHINPEHRDFCWFLWFKDNDPNGQIIKYGINVHLFGAISSLGVANFGLRMTAEAGREEFGQEVADFLQNEFYVDDGPLPCWKMPSALSGILKPCTQLSTYVYSSNSKTVLEALPMEDRSKDSKDLDLSHDVLPVQGQAIHLPWNFVNSLFCLRPIRHSFTSHFEREAVASRTVS